MYEPWPPDNSVFVLYVLNPVMGWQTFAETLYYVCLLSVCIRNVVNCLLKMLCEDYRRN